jgi:hypothetical protein
MRKVGAKEYVVGFRQKAEIRMSKGRIHAFPSGRIARPRNRGQR